jgi:hypothetical protein
MITEGSLRKKGYKMKRYYKKVWNWRKFKFELKDVYRYKFVMEDIEGNTAHFEFKNHVILFDRNNNYIHSEGH